MKRRSVFHILSAVGLLMLPLLPAAAYELYSPGDWEVERLQALYFRSGVVFPVASYPLDARTLHGQAQALRRKAPTRELRGEIDWYIDRLAFKKEERFVDTRLDLAYEQFLRGAEAEFEEYYDFDRIAVEPPPLILLDLSAGEAGRSGTSISGEIRRQYEPGSFPSSTMFEPEDASFFSFENYFLTEGYFACRFDTLLLLFGRMPVHYGPSAFSTALPSKRLPYMDALYCQWYLGPLTMTAQISTVPNHAAEGEIEAMIGSGLDIDTTKLDADGRLGDPDPAGNSYIAFDETTVLVALHRFEWAFTKLRLGVSNMQIVSRPGNSFYIGDFFPVFSWHTAELGMHNNSLVVEADWNVFPSAELFFQAAYDDINAGELLGVGDYEIPTIYSYIGGLSYYLEGGALRGVFSLEGGLSHYLWGNFHEFDVERGNYLSRAIYRYKRDAGYIAMPMTSPHGPGARWIHVDIAMEEKAEKGRGLRAALHGEFLWKNREASLISTSYEEHDDVRRSSLEFSLLLGLPLEYPLTERISAVAEPVFISRASGSWAELSLGAAVEFGSRTILEGREKNP